MSCNLCISVRFLLGRYHGRTEGDRAAEWPPSPLRLFQALVAATHRGSGETPLPDADERALRWLEGEPRAPRAAPLIVSSDTLAATPYLISVPNNDLDKPAKKSAAGKEPAENEQPNKLRTMKTVRPTAMDERSDNGFPAVHFVWPLAKQGAAAESLIATLDRLARRIVAFGWGTDLVAAHAHAVTSLPEGTKWNAVQTLGTIRSRRLLPSPGTLDALRQQHARFLARINIDEKQYDHVRPYIDLDEAGAPRRIVTYIAEGAVPSRPCTTLTLRPVIDPALAEQDTPEGAAERRKTDQFRAFRASSAAKVAAMLRHAACEAAQRPGAWTFAEDSSRYVAGHGDGGKRRAAGDKSPRFSYLALPSIGHAHADGMIRRVVVAEPFGGDGEHAAWAERTLAGLALVDEDTRRPVATLERLDRSDAAERKMLARFVGPSREWVTTTPIVLPGFDDLKTDKAVALLSRACDQAGLPQGSVESFEFIGPPARGDGRYFVPAYLRGLPLRHVVVRFKHDARGPIAIGAGRHCGLGVLAVGSTSLPPPRPSSLTSEETPSPTPRVRWW